MTDPKERLKQLKEEEKSLRDQILEDFEKKKKDEVAYREMRDLKVEKIQEKLKIIISRIYEYNKLGKEGKMQSDIFGHISEIIEREDINGRDNTKSS